MGEQEVVALRKHLEVVHDRWFTRQDARTLRWADYREIHRTIAPECDWSEEA